MAVNIKSIGNYDTQLVRNNFKKTDTKNDPLNPKAELDNDEKGFFASLYPEKQNEIMNYSFYERTGKMNGVSLGTNIDKRG